MKTVAELNAWREQAKQNMQKTADNKELTRVVVGLATCGIAAGATPVMEAFQAAVQEKGLGQVAVVRTGCIGMCQYEPIVEVTRPGEEKATYVKMSPDKVARIVDEHLINGKVVEEYTVGAHLK